MQMCDFVVSAALCGAACCSCALGQESDWVATGGPGGGPVASFGAVDDVLLAGGSGGLVRSIDGGMSWSAVEAALPGVTAMATVDGRVIAGDSGGGVFVSVDEGVTWDHVATPAPGDAAIDLHVDGSVTYLVSKNELFFVPGQLWRSGDGGESWNEIALLADENGTYGAQRVYADGDLLLVGAANPIAPGVFSEILRSTNAGASWEAIPVPGGLPIEIRAIVSVEGTLFAGSMGGVAKSIDMGQTWELTQGAGGHPAPPQVRDMIGVGRDVIFVGTKLDGGQEDVGPGVWRSEDLGETWARIDAGLPVPSLHQTSDLFSANGVLLIGGTTFSMYVSSDDGASWQKSVDGLPFASTRAMAAGNDGLFASPGATQEVWRLQDGDWTVHELPLEPGSSHTHVLSLFAEEMVLAGTQGKGIFRSTDGGETYGAVNTGVPTYNGTAGLQRREIEAFAGSGQTIYAGTGLGTEFINGQFTASGGGALKSTNGGTSWQSINNGLPIIDFNNFNDPVFEPIGAMIEVDGVLLAGHQLTSGVYRSTNGGTSWQVSNAGLGVNPAVMDFAVFDGAIYASGFLTGIGVRRSNDGGVTWEPAGAGLPIGQFIPTLKSADGVLYAGVSTLNAEAGVYATTDGTTWSRVGESLDGVSIRHLDADDGGRVFAGTTDRSVWALGEDCAADFNGDGALNILDFVAFQNAFVGGDGAADCDGNGALNVLDFVCFHGVFQGGCGG